MPTGQEMGPPGLEILQADKDAGRSLQHVTASREDRWQDPARSDGSRSPGSTGRAARTPAFKFENFKRVFKSERDLLDDLSQGMQRFNPHGAYVAMVWEGTISGEQAMSRQRPHFQVWENGDVNVVT